MILDALAKEYKIDLSKPFNKLSERDRNLILYGTDGYRLNIYYKGAHSEGTFDTAFDGIMGNIRRRYREASESARQEYEQYMQIIPCETCKGKRLKKEALAVTVGDKKYCKQCGVSYLEHFAEYSSGENAPTEQSEWEHILQKALSDAGIPVTAQYHVDKYYLDLALFHNGKKLDIEVDGAMYILIIHKC